jgi:hypothetical protein
MPREFADAVYVSGHKGHDLRLGREIIFVVLPFGVPFGDGFVPVILITRCVI